MRRRDFITVLGGAAAWPLAARAQRVNVPVIGFLDAGTLGGNGWALPGFREGLRELGFIEGQNVAIEYRAGENQDDRLPALAAELVQRRVAVIVAAPGFTSIAAAKAATATIPIVFMSASDPVRTGLVASLNRPGGNLTGLTLLSSDLSAKRFGMLHAMVPQVATVAMLLARNGPVQDFSLAEAEAAGRAVGVRIFGVTADSEGEFDTAFATAIREGAGALMIQPSVFFVNHTDRLVELTARHRLPAIYHEHDFTVAGGLMSYGPNRTDVMRQVGVYAGRVLKGEKPDDLPVMQPTKFDLVVNLKTANALGLTVPPSLLAIADDVIE
jgi:putative tryptophan/tyrosine transport system substrate-binding protein